MQIISDPSILAYLVLAYFHLTCIVLGFWLYAFAKIAYFKLKSLSNERKHHVEQSRVNRSRSRHL